MGTINELNTTDTLADDDKLVLWKTQAGATRAITAIDAAGYFAGGAFQPLDELLTSIAALGPTTTADRMIYTTAQDVAALTPITAFGRSLLDDANAAAALATLGADGIYARLAVANTFTKGQTISLAGSETSEALISSVGGVSDPRTIPGAFGYFANRMRVYGAPDNGGNGIQTALFSYSNFPSGQGALTIGLLARGEVSGTWTTGTFESGAQGLWGEGYSSRGGTLFGGYFGVNRTTTAGGLSRGIEIDFFRSVNDQSMIALEIASPEANKGTVTGSATINGGATIEDGAAVRVTAITGGTGPGIPYPYGIMTIQQTSGAPPIDNALWIAGGFAVDEGFNFKSLTTTNGYLYGGNNQEYVTGRNAANSADVNLLKLDGSNRITFYDDKIWMNLLGNIVQNLTGADALNMIRATSDGNGEKFVVWRDVVSGYQGLQWKQGVYNSSGDMGLARYNATDVFQNYAWWARWSDGVVFLPDTGNNTTANAANMYIDAATGQLYRSTSADDQKTAAERLEDEYALKIVEAVSDAAIYYRSLGKGDNPAWGWYGVSANKLAEKIPQLATYQTAEVRNVEKTRKIRKIVERSAVVMQRQKKTREIEVEVVDPRDKVELSARQTEQQQRMMAGEPPLPDDGWRPRTSVTRRTEDVYTLQDEVNPETGEPVFEEEIETDENGRYIIENGKPKVRRTRRQMMVFEYEDVPVTENWQEEVEVDEVYVEKEAVPLETPKVTGAAYERMTVAACRVIDRLLERVEKLEARLAVKDMEIPEEIEIPRFLAPDPLEDVPASLIDLAEPGETVLEMQARLWSLWLELNGKLMLGLATTEETALHSRLHNELHWSPHPSKENKPWP
jgi:hypothetical protein